MTMVCGPYGLGANSRILYNLEAVSCTASATQTNYLGLIPDDVEFPNPNPQTALGSINHTRNPKVYSGNEREYPVSIPTLPIDARIPLETCIGSRVTASVGDRKSVV